MAGPGATAAIAGAAAVVINANAARLREQHDKAVLECTENGRLTGDCCLLVHPQPPETVYLPQWGSAGIGAMAALVIIGIWKALLKV